MRILFCNKYNFRFSGTEAYLFDVMELLQLAGHQVALFSMDCGEAGAYEYEQYLVPKVDFKEQRQPPWTRVRQAAHVIYSCSARRKLQQAIMDFRPDIAHIRNIYHHLSPSILWEFRAQGIPVLYQVNDFKMICPAYTLTSHGGPCERCRGGAFWHLWSEHCYSGSRSASGVLLAEAYIQKWLRTYSRCVTRVMAPTQFVRQKLIENGWDAGKIDVLYHFQRIAQEATVPAQDAPILYFGRLSAEKGITDLLRAMHGNPQIPLLLAGDGPQRPDLERLARELQLSNVRFLGKLYGEDLNRAVASARFTVFPSHGGEVLGKTILESYAQARPVIASDLGSRRELVLAGKTGLLYACGDYAQLAAQIAFFYARPQLADDMGRAGRELLRQRHSPEDHLATLTAIYERLWHESNGRVPPKSTARPTVRVAFIGGRGVVSRYSGIEAYYEEIGKRLAEMGHEVTIYCRSYFTPRMEFYWGMRLIRLPTVRTKHLETLVHTFLSTLHAMFGNYDIVHYHALGPALFSWIPRLLGKKTLVTVQGLDWRRKKWGGVASAVLRTGEWAAARFPNATMVVSRTLQEHYRGHYPRNTVLVPNGTYLRERRAAGYLASWNLEPENYLLFLGRFSPEKNCDLLIRAYQRIDTKVKLVLAGGSSYSDGYARELQSHSSEQIRVLNWVSGEALEELLTNALLFVLPSDLEGLSLALLDAMGAGLCVLASDVPENREAVEGAGFTFKAGDEDALAEMLRRLIASPGLRKQAGRAAQERIRQHYLWPQIASQIEREYLKVLGWGKESRRGAPQASDESNPFKAA
jgi:glycosyltransferase involved in cell wall biosynthesis